MSQDQILKQKINDMDLYITQQFARFTELIEVCHKLQMEVIDLRHKLREAQSGKETGNNQPS